MKSDRGDEGRRAIEDQMAFEPRCHRGADCCSEPASGEAGTAGVGFAARPLSARAARNPHLTEEEREAAEAEAAEWVRVCNRC